MANSSNSSRPAVMSGRPVINVPRPERYAVEDGPFSPPPLDGFLHFDSSSIFEKHPRKYKILIGLEESELKKQETVTVQAGLHGRSHSLEILNQFGEGDQLRVVETVSVAKRMISTPVRTTFETDKVSDKSLKEFRAAIYRKQLEDANGNTQSSMIPTPKKQSVTATAPSRSSSSMEPLPSTSVAAEMTAGAIDESSSGRESPTSNEEEGESYTTVDYQPQPRRLFGIGPFFQPLPETAKVKKLSIVDQVKSEGITARAASRGKQETQQGNVAQSKQEMNFWSPSSM